MSDNAARFAMISLMSFSSASGIVAKVQLCDVALRHEPTAP